MRYELTHNEWAAIRPMLPNRPRGVPRVDDRRVLNGIFWMLRSGAQWRDHAGANCSEGITVKGEPFNTAENELGAGLEELILEAVRNSGYPLQTTIASSLRMDFSVQEEWSFLDSDTGALRTLDIYATRRLWDFRSEPQPFVKPALDLLIECKQSDLPFIFFVAATRPWLRDFPYFAGLAQETIVVSTDDDFSTWSESILSALSLTEHPLVTHAVEPCMSISKCVRKGKEIELSGTDAYQNVVLPLVKALRYPPRGPMFHLYLQVAQRRAV